MNGAIKNNRAFYKGKRVFVTGHTGFKGSWLTVMLNYLGAEVKGYALAPEAGSLYETYLAFYMINNNSFPKKLKNSNC